MRQLKQLHGHFKIISQITALRATTEQKLISQDSSSGEQYLN